LDFNLAPDLPLGNNLESVLLILAALFLCITFFLAALSAKDIALRIFSEDFALLATRIETSNFLRMDEFNSDFLLEDLKALLAVFVTGMGRV